MIDVLIRILYKKKVSLKVLYHMAILKSYGYTGMGALVVHPGYVIISHLNIWNIFVCMAYVGRIFRL
jgi:hypothetical protein